jgi:hypothetical protein
MLQLQGMSFCQWQISKPKTNPIISLIQNLGPLVKLISVTKGEITVHKRVKLRLQCRQSVYSFDVLKIIKMKKIIIIFIMLFALKSFGQDPTDRFLGLKYADVSKLVNVRYVVPPKTTQGILKPAIDLSKDFPPILSQGSIGSCASWASVYAARSYTQKVKENYEYTFNNVLDESKVFSPLFIYNQVKLTDQRCDSVGSYLKDNLELMKKSGVCKKITFDPKPYDFTACNINPLNNLNATAEAGNYKISSYGWFARYGESYHPGYKLLKIKEFLNKGYPVIFGADIDYTFWTKGGDKVGDLKIWSRYDGTPVGSHAMVCVGYNDTLKAIKIFNSWGTNWGNKGYGWISYNMIDDFIFETYVINVDALVTTNTANITYTPANSQSGRDIETFSKGSDYNFFIKDRYQPYNNIRIMPVEIDKNNNSGILKIYERKEGKSIQIDVFSLKVGDTYTFSSNNFNYEFKLEAIKPYRFLGAQAIYYTIKWNNQTNTY